ncbi:MAG: ABC transporter permease [Deltaproteobacteria bacterium]|nr:ABC transporter permease [Deltaproteobacteria bacterium]MBI3387830.1 ABC transporter permease [Deltaproteobacteria bacterium]
MKYFGLIRANLGRNKLRTALTGGAIMLAVVLVCLLLTMPAGLDAILNSVASNTRISVHNKGGVVYSMPFSFTRKVREVDGVAAATATMWFGGAFEEEGRVTFPNFAVEAEHVGAVYPDYNIPAEQLADFQRYRDGAIVGRQTMQKYGWKIGDRITLRSTVWPANLDLRIVGEMPRETSPLLWLNWTYLDEALKAKGMPGLGIANVIWVRASDPNRVNAIMRQIDDMSHNSEAETACETEKSYFANFFGSLKGFLTIILIVTGLVALCIVFIAANTASMGVRERSGELAVLKAIGFGRRVIFGTLFAEAVALSTVAGSLGVLLTIGLTHALKASTGWNPALGPLGSFIVTAPVVVQGIFLSLFVGMLAGLVPSFGAARKPVVQTLHEVF